jgi:hypothetical protein
MKHIIFFGLALAASFATRSRADETSALRWHFQLRPSAPAVGETAELVITAEIDQHWLIYSSDFKAEIGPQPTAFDFSISSGIELLGPARSIEPKRRKDKTWEIDLGYFERRAEFRQQVKIVRGNFVLRGTIAGQLCNEQEGTCTLFTEPILLGAGADLAQR